MAASTIKQHQIFQQTLLPLSLYARAYYPRLKHHHFLMSVKECFPNIRPNLSPVVPPLYVVYSVFPLSLIRRKKSAA